ncbi:hypothetical protein EDD85DRAFT_786259 [Armillaria nabsnona]|nr:hypothetical protein EDD85DRAFT_786259 [Armillaria nabsnona]
MQQLAQETKDTIASYLHSKSDLASLTMVDRTFASAGRQARFRTIHISESSPSPLLIRSYNIKCLHDRWYLGTAVSAGNAICEKFPEIGRNVRRIVFFATYLKIEDVVALMRLLSKAPFVREFVFMDTDLHFFKDAFGALLSSMEHVSALVFKGCSISTQSLDTITRVLPRLKSLNLGSTNDYNVSIMDVTAQTILTLSQLTDLRVGFRLLGWEGDSLSYGWINGMRFEALQSLSIHVHHESDVEVVNMVLSNALAITHLYLNLWRTLPYISLEVFQLHILSVPRSWTWFVKPPECLSKLDATLCKIIDISSVRGVVISCTRGGECSKDSESLAHWVKRKLDSIRTLPADMNTLSQETVDHILSFLTSKADLCRSSLISNTFLGQCRQQLFYNVRGDIREVRYCGGSIGRADVDGLKRLFAQLPRARSLVLEGVSGDFNRFDLLKGALKEIEHVTFKACILYAEDLNDFLPGLPRLTKMTVAPSTLVEVDANDLCSETSQVLARLRSLDLSMPEMEDDGVDENYDWLQFVWFPSLSELRIHLYCEWWCSRANFLMRGLRGENVERLILDVYPYDCIDSTCDHKKCFISMSSLTGLRSLSIVTGDNGLQLLA